MKNILLIMFVSLIISSSVSAHQDEQTMKSPMMKMLHQLDLSTQQKQDVKQLLDSNRADRNVYKGDAKQLKRELRTLINADTWDQSAVSSALAAQTDMQQHRMNNRALTQHKIWLLLTAEQQQKLLDMLAKHDGQGHQKNNKANREQHQWDKILSRLDLSAIQKEQVEQIRAEHQQQQVAFRQLKQSTRALEHAIIRADSFDQQAWESLFTEHQSAMLDNAIAKAYMQHQMHQVLTESQRKQLAKMQRKMKHSFFKKTDSAREKANHQ